jgi:flagellar biosynthesis chaperone FliJ
MEGPVKLKHAFLSCAMALALAAGLTGCKDEAALKALQDLTGELSNQVAEKNQELTNVAKELQTCLADLAKTKNEAVVIEAADATVEAPSLEGEANMASLEALKTALNETIDKQKTALSELKTKVEQCGKDLEAAKAAAEAAAAEAAKAAEAAAAEAAAAEAAAKKPKKKEPTMVKEREAEGRPTTGVGSRYQKRQ